MTHAAITPAEVAELGRRSLAWNPLAGLFPQQRAFVTSKAKRKAALCTRRAGKSTGNVHELYDTASKHPRSIVPYFGVTQKVARRTIWPELNRMNEEHGLGMKLDRGNLEATLKNGAQIWVCGCKDENEIEKARGFKYPKVILDEVASYRQMILQRLVDEIVEPALMDQDGVLSLTGTPGRTKLGLFFDITRPESEKRAAGWEVSSWSVLDNPHIPNARAYIEALKIRRGWTEQTAAFLREYRGLWVSGEDELVYCYDTAINDFDFDELPTGELHHVLALDVGFRDRTAFSVGAWSDNDPAYWGVHEEALPNMIPSAIAAHIKVLRDRYKPEAIVMDCGGLGLSMAEEFRQKHNLPIEAAEKKEKFAIIEFLNGDLRRGLVRVRDDSPLVEEWKVIQYEAKARGADPRFKKEDPHIPNDLADAFLYGYRRARHYLAQPREDLTERQIIERQVEASIRARYEHDDLDDYSSFDLEG